jgi:hypothetical protein
VNAKTRGVLVAVLVSGQVYAGEPESASADQSSEQNAIKRYVSLGPGVYQLQYATLEHGDYQLQTENRALQSCIVVGQSRIRTLLGVRRGLIGARRNALFRAEKEFIEWVKANVKAVEYSGQEAILYLDEVEAAGNPFKKSGKSIQTSGAAIASASQKAIHGLQVLGFDQDEKTGIFTTVLGWSPANASFGGEPGAVNEAEYTAESGEGASKGTMTGGVPNKDIESKTVVSENAGDPP